MLKNIFYSFPVQLLLLHFKRYQVLLFFWYILILTINGHFMKSFGADALFLAPEYLGSVNALGAALVGIATGVFIMSWNITTFILHSRRCKFLATTNKTFLKYCINNSIIPIFFVLFYFSRALDFGIHKELMTTVDFITVTAGFFGGLFILISFSLIYSFGTDRRIKRTLVPIYNPVQPIPDENQPANVLNKYGMNVGYFISTGFRFKKARSVAHYSEEFLDSVFKRHHFAAMVSILLAFLFLMIIGFFLDNTIFQVPAAASILLFFAIMIAVMGSLSYFLRSWSILFIIGLFIVVDFLYRHDVIDPRNRAYGINYINKSERPEYNQESLLKLCTQEKISADKKNMIKVLNNWKGNQDSAKPVMIFLNFSGGGVRSASFAMNVLQQLDSVLEGRLMQKTFMLTGASGGMLSAAYFRELYRQKNNGSLINLQNNRYADDISGDLLNPIFSSLIARDLLAPSQKFSIGPYRYVKDRGYAFEQKLNENTHGFLNKNVKDYTVDEFQGKIPLMLFNSVVTRDGRKMIIGTQPMSFMMQSPSALNDSLNISPDAIDFGAMFSKQDPFNIRVLTALRMNATFPYVLPNVWLPSNPVIDVMDAGLRDNFGQETAIRFIYNFREWIEENTGGMLMIQIRDTKRGGWDHPYDTEAITSVITKPATIVQYNWNKLQEYFQNDQLAYVRSSMDSNFQRVSFMYYPEESDKGAALNFHLTAREKKEIHASLKRGSNVAAFEEVKRLVK